MTNDDLVINLTVGELKQLLSRRADEIEQAVSADYTERRYAYGIAGIANALGCSMTTVVKLKKAGRFDGCLKQVGRKIIFDVEGFLKTKQND